MKGNNTILSPQNKYPKPVPRFQMKNSDYGSILKDLNITYTQKEKLLIRPGFEATGWVLSFSVITYQGMEACREVFSLLKNQLSGSIGFRIPKTVQDHDHLNGGMFGNDNVGRALVFTTNSTYDVQALIVLLSGITGKYKGVTVMNGIKVAENLFLQYIDNNSKLVDPKTLQKKHPFLKDKNYTITKRSKYVGHGYILIEMLSDSFKGMVHTCVNWRKANLSFRLMKTGYKNACCDPFGRTIQDRFLWQKSTLEYFKNLIPVPKVVDYFEANENYHLVTEYVDGQNIVEMVLKAYGEEKMIDKNKQLELLEVYKKILGIIKIMHDEKYVHRDITPMNFVINKKGQVSVIDFELSYSLRSKTPEPPFGLGTFGYMSPEQMCYYVPTYKEDSFSLGCLLAYILTGKHPKPENLEHPSQLRKYLEPLVDHKYLSLIMLCNSPDPNKRPTVQEIIDYINDINL